MKYILYNKVVLDYKFIYLTYYWEHNGDACPGKQSCFMLR